MTRRKGSGQPKRKRRPPPPKLKPQRSEQPHRERHAAAQRGILPKDVPLELPMWIDEQGVHTLIPGDRPDPQTLKRMTEAFQQKLRNSPLYQQLVDAHGPVKAEELILQCQAELR
jgi:hypothetical protein